MNGEKFCHIFNRGVDRRTVFMDDCDRRRFLKTLSISNNVEERADGTPLEHPVLNTEHDSFVRIHCYCLMTNHYHLLLEEIVPDGISRFMQRLGNSYTRYFNIRHERNGYFLGTKYDFTPVISDAHLLHVTRYIHLNPLDMMPKTNKNAVDPEAALTFLKVYPWSSYQYFDKLERHSLIEGSFLWKEFPDPKVHGKFLQEWIA